MAKQTNKQAASDTPVSVFDYDAVTLDANMRLDVSIARRNGDGTVLQFRLGDMPQAAVERMLRYGAQRIFNDAVGGSDMTPTDKVAAAQAMIDRFKAGQVGRQPRATVDAVTHEAYKLLRAALPKDKREALKARAPEEQGDILGKLLERNPAIREQAEEIVRKRAESGPAVDMGGIDL